MSAGDGSCYLLQQHFSNTNRGIITVMTGKRGPAVMICRDVANRVVPPGAGPSRPSGRRDSNGQTLVDIPRYRAAGATRNNTKAR